MKLFGNSTLWKAGSVWLKTEVPGIEVQRGATSMHQRVEKDRAKCLTSSTVCGVVSYTCSNCRRSFRRRHDITRHKCLTTGPVGRRCQIVKPRHYAQSAEKCLISYSIFYGLNFFPVLLSIHTQFIPQG